jgi:hypothetical protein
MNEYPYTKREGNKGKIVLVLSLILLAAGIGSFAYLYFQMSLGDGTETLKGSLENQIERAIKSEGSYRLALGNGSHCYWIRPTHNGTNYLVEIREYSSSNSCFGDLIEIKTIVVDGPVNVNGRCVCGKICDFETKKVGDAVHLNLITCEV